MAGTSVIINQGTQTPVAGDYNNGTFFQAVRVDNGSVTIPSGSLNVSTGTVQQNPLPPFAQLTYGTLGTAGGAGFGTLIGTVGAGTEIFVSGVSIVVNTGTVDAAILFGTNGGNAPQGTGLIERGNFSAGAGISQRYTNPVNSGTNGQLCYWLGGAGTVLFSVKYFTQASTL